MGMTPLELCGVVTLGQCHEASMLRTLGFFLVTKGSETHCSAEVRT